MAEFLYRDADWLREKYWGEDLSLAQIASISETQDSTVLRWMKKHGIPRRDRVTARRVRLEKYGIGRCGTRSKPESTSGRRSSPNFDAGFFDEWNKKMAYVVGFSLSDGSVQVNRETGYTVLLLINTDLPTLEQMARAVWFSGRMYSRKREGAKTVYRLPLRKRFLYRTLEKYCIVPNKAHRLRMPDVPRGYFGHFLRGYFDGDGSVGMADHDRAKVTFGSSSRGFIRSLADGLVSFGCSERNIYNNREFFSIVYGSKYDVRILYNLMYDDADILMGRKKNIFDNAPKCSYEIVPTPMYP